MPIENDKTCGKCRYFVYARGPTNRKRPNEPGGCSWSHEVLENWPKEWPIAFQSRDSWSGRQVAPTPPKQREQIFEWTYRSLGSCPCWKAKEEEKETSCQIQL